ncbi:MAG: rhodanese-like domain-containing protein [Candidatus Dormibacteraceae bacterium]
MGDAYSARGTLTPFTVDDLLDRARKRLARLDPVQVATEVAKGALLVDIRPAEQRAEGEVPGAVVIDRNVLEWRLDPASRWRIPEVTGHDIRLIVICNEGYASSLVAAELHELGLVNATDVIGGFQAWRAAGLPTTRG